MGLLDFVKDAGQKLFGGEDTGKTEVVRTPEMARADKSKGEMLSKMVRDMDMKVDDLHVGFRDGVATLEGRAASQAEREKVALLVGNVQGVARVDDRLEVAKAEPEATLYTVRPGDTLSKIAKQHYGKAMKYMKIFEANRPMLDNPDRIYPGQVLRIPPLDD